MTWAYFYFMKKEPGRVRKVAPRHAHYWRVTGSIERGAAPFSDRSGGLIIFEAPDEQSAEDAVAEDPFQRAVLLEQWWLKGWEPADEPRTP